MCNDLDPPPQDFFEFKYETRRKPGACCWTHVHEKINVTVWAVVTAYGRTEDTNVMRTMFGSNAKYVTTLFVKKLLCLHIQPRLSSLDVAGLRL